jgi:hypothetical protein
MAGQLASDPSYLAYMRALGFEEASAVNDSARARGVLERRQGLVRPELEYQHGLESNQLEGSLEERGMFRSGHGEQSRAELVHSQQYRLADLDLAYGENLAELEANLARRIAGIEHKRTEQHLGTGGAIYYRTGAAPYEDSVLY